MSWSQAARERSKALDSLYWENHDMEYAVTGAPIGDIKLALSVAEQVALRQGHESDDRHIDVVEQRRHGVLAVTSLLGACREAGYEIPEELDTKRISDALAGVLGRGTVAECEPSIEWEEIRHAA